MRELTSAVELESRLERDALLGGARLRVCLLGGVEGVHVGLVVLLVVKLHDLLGDEGLEAIVGVWEVGENVGHGVEVFESDVGDEKELARRLDLFIEPHRPPIGRAPVLDNDVIPMSSHVIRLRPPPDVAQHLPTVVFSVELAVDDDYDRIASLVLPFALSVCSQHSFQGRTLGRQAPSVRSAIVI